MKKLKKMVEESFQKWIRALGLAWWDIQVEFYTDQVAIANKFPDVGSGKVIAAEVTPHWEYCSAKIDVNLLAFSGRNEKEIDEIVVHELVHILVCEMREKGIKHEERVVTNVARAIFWALGNLAKAVEDDTDS